MFKGNNTLELNEATLMAAVQEYLNSRIVSGDDDFKVTSVREKDHSLSGRLFAVQVSQLVEEK